MKSHILNVVEKLFPDLFLKNENLAYLWINSLKLYTIFSILYQVEDYPNILKPGYRSLAFTWYKALLENKKSLTLAWFLHDSWRKTSLLFYSIDRPDVIFFLLLLRETLASICIAIVYLPNFLERWDFEFKVTK